MKFSLASLLFINSYRWFSWQELTLSSGTRNKGSTPENYLKPVIEAELWGVLELLEQESYTQSLSSA